MASFRKTLTDKEIITGDHVISLEDKVVKEFSDPDYGRDSLLTRVVDEVNKERSRLPDYDSGYLKVDADTEYEIEHSLGRIPIRVVAYFCEDEKPKYAKKNIYIESNVLYKGMNDSVMLFKTPSNFGGSGSGITSGYIRIMVWR